MILVPVALSAQRGTQTGIPNNACGRGVAVFRVTERPLLQAEGQSRSLSKGSRRRVPQRSLGALGDNGLQAEGT